MTRLNSTSTVQWSVSTFGRPPKQKLTAEGLANRNGAYTLPQNNGCFRPSGRGSNEIYWAKVKEREEARKVENAEAAEAETDILQRLEDKKEDLARVRQTKRWNEAETIPLSEFMLPPRPSCVHW